jgi:hypothetical protein
MTIVAYARMAELIYKGIEFLWDVLMPHTPQDMSVLCIR